MTKSLQEQLIAAGLATKGQAKKIGQAKRKQSRAPGKKPNQSAEARRRYEQAQADKARSDKALEEKRKVAQRQRELAAQVAQLVRDNKLDREDGLIAHRFAHRGKVKQIYVNQQQHDGLAGGKLAIVCVASRYELVPVEVAARIGERDAAAVVHTHSDDSAPADDDPYRDFQVPDDLMW